MRTFYLIFDVAVYKYFLQSAPDNNLEIASVLNLISSVFCYAIYNWICIMHGIEIDVLINISSSYLYNYTINKTYM